jgi:trans-AT polyketide synthase/acyltransferase/oxidoreductase domain-containing protein
MSIALFPGQGSQSKAWAVKLFDRFGDWTTQADAILQYSIRELSRRSRRRLADGIHATRALRRECDDIATEDGKPALQIAGHSLGERAARGRRGLLRPAA